MKFLNFKRTGMIIIWCEKINCSYDVKKVNFSIVKVNFVVKSKFVCKFIFQLCGFIYATFIFKRFD